MPKRNQSHLSLGKSKEVLKKLKTQHNLSVGTTAIPQLLTPKKKIEKLKKYRSEILREIAYIEPMDRDLFLDCLGAYQGIVGNDLWSAVIDNYFSQQMDGSDLYTKCDDVQIKLEKLGIDIKISSDDVCDECISAVDKSSLTWEKLNNGKITRELETILMNKCIDKFEKEIKKQEKAAHQPLMASTAAPEAPTSSDMPSAGDTASVTSTAAPVGPVSLFAAPASSDVPTAALGAFTNEDVATADPTVTSLVSGM